MRVAAHVGIPLVDRPKRQTSTASPAKPGGLSLTLDAQFERLLRSFRALAGISDPVPTRTGLGRSESRDRTRELKRKGSLVSQVCSSTLLIVED